MTQFNFFEKNFIYSLQFLLILNTLLRVSDTLKELSVLYWFCLYMIVFSYIYVAGWLLLIILHVSRSYFLN